MVEILKNNKSLILILFLGTILRFFNLGSHSLWNDEMDTLYTAKMSLSDYIFTAVPIDLHPPLFISILHFVTYIGTSNFVMRTIPAIFGIATILISYIFITKIFGKEYGIMTAFLLAISPYNIFYSQEMRPYTLMTFLSVVSLYFFYELCIGNRKAWLGWIGLSIILMYTHYYSIFLILAQVIYYVYTNRKETSEIVPMVRSLLVMFIAYLPLILFMLINGIINPIPSAFPHTNGSLSVVMINVDWHPQDSLNYYGTLIPAIFFKMSIVQSHTVLIPVEFLKATLIMFIPLFLYGIYKAYKINKMAVEMLMFYMAITIIVPLIISIGLNKPLMSTQQYPFMQPVYFGFLSVGLMCMSKAKRLIVGCGIMLIYAYSLYEYWFLLTDSNWIWMLQL